MPPLTRQLSIQGYDLAFASGPKRFSNGKVPTPAARLAAAGRGLHCPYCKILCDSQEFYDMHLEWKHKSVMDARARLLQSLKQPLKVDPAAAIAAPEPREKKQRTSPSRGGEEDDMLDLSLFKIEEK